MASPDVFAPRTTTAGSPASIYGTQLDSIHTASLMALTTTCSPILTPKLSGRQPTLSFSMISADKTAT